MSLLNNKKVGCFIASLRKEKLMTQQDLADKLNVTSKAVSKWETGQGYPEITTIPLLAEILGVTTGELLNGELNTKESSDKVVATTIINETVNYINEAKAKNNNTSIMVLSIVFLFSAFVCILCNYLIQGAITWSLYPTGALIVLWSLLFPLIKFKKFKALGLLLGLTITAIPYLFLVQYLTHTKGWVNSLAIPITLLSLIALGIVFYIFNHTIIKKIYCVAITIFLYGVVVNVSIAKIVDNFLDIGSMNNVSVFITASASGFLSVVLFIIGFMKRKQEKGYEHDI